MSGYQHREGFGSLFPNKKERDNHPDMKGDAMFNGVIVEVAGWKKTTGNGKEYISIKIGEKRQPSQPQQPREAPQGRGGASRDDDLNSDIPF